MAIKSMVTRKDFKGRVWGPNWFGALARPSGNAFELLRINLLLNFDTKR